MFVTYYSTNMWTNLCIYVLSLGLSIHSCWSSCVLPDSRGLVAKCFQEGRKVSCQRQVAPGIIVKLSCKEQYKATPTTETTQWCTSKGIWSGEPISCSPECGTSEVHFQQHVIHGQPARRGEWPWHAAIYISKNGEWDYRCGGSLIRDDIVMTAAHCVTPLGITEPFDNEELLVVLGKHFRKESTHEAHAQSRQIRRISVHPDFNPLNFEDDLALIFLSCPIEITYDVRTVCSPIKELLVEEFQLQEGSEGVVVGFGKTETGELADELLHAIIDYIPESRCKEILPLNVRTIVKPSIFCVGNLNETNVCQGDSGSGMVFQHEINGNQKWYIQGVVSGGLPPDSTSHLPCNTKITFFTRVSYFADWIEEEIHQIVDSGEESAESVRSKNLENRLKSVDETMKQILEKLQEEEISSKVIDIKQQTEELQIQNAGIADKLNFMEEKVNEMQTSVASNLKTQILREFDNFKKKLDEMAIKKDIKDLLSEFSKLGEDVEEVKHALQGKRTEITETAMFAINNVTIAVAEIQKNIATQTKQTGFVNEVSSLREDMKKLINDRCGLEPMSGPSNCAEIQKSGQRVSGIYTVIASSVPLQVYCDMETDGGGWTVFQRRDDVTPNIDFFRYWADFKVGFGDLNKEFWLGLDSIHALTSHQSMSLRVDMEDFEGNKKFAFYPHFSIGDEFDKYRLYIEGYQGDAGDSLTVHNGHAFSTRERDNDQKLAEHCAKAYQGAWWHHLCHLSNLNGRYLRGLHSSFANGINWYTWKGHYYSLKKTEMKIRPIDF